MSEESIEAGATPIEKRLLFRISWGCALLISFIISVYAALRGGYVGPDYNTHLARVLDGARIFDFAAMDPPIFCLISQGFLRLIGRTNAFIISLSIFQAAINILALWFFFLYTERRFKSALLHLAFVIFLTFLPVRIIHAVCLGTDWMTIPVFVLVLYLFDNFLSEQTSTWKNALFLGLALALGVWSKYSFVSLLPAVLVVFVFLWIKRKWKLTRFVAYCLLSMLLPSILVLYGSWKSSHVKGFATQKIWLAKGESPEMSYKDLFWVKMADLDLFKAPEMFKHEPSDGNNYHVGYRRAHLHSYLGLSHMSTYTDTQNLFQDLPNPQNIDSFLIPDFKVRRPWKTPYNVAAMSLGTLWTILALVGTPWLLFGAVRNLFRDRLEHEDVAGLLGTAFFLLMFLPIPFIAQSCLQGFWTPRLILPPMLFFFWAGFLFLDRTFAPNSRTIGFVTLALVVAQSAIEVVVLV